MAYRNSRPGESCEKLGYGPLFVIPQKHDSHPGP